MDANLKAETYQFDYGTLAISIDGTASEDKIEFSSNIWDGNYAGGSEGLIDIRGIHRTHFYNETFSNNGENTIQVYEALRNYANDNVDLYTEGDFEEANLDYDSIDPMNEIELRMKSLIYFKACSYVHFEEITTQNNFVFESAHDNTRAVFLFGDDFNG